MSQYRRVCVVTVKYKVTDWTLRDTANTSVKSMSLGMGLLPNCLRTSSQYPFGG